MTSKFGGQRARKVANLQFSITTLYPSIDLQIWKSKREKRCKFPILNHHSLPFKWPPNLEVKAPEKLQICNFESQLPTLQMTSKFRGQNARKVASVQFSITTPYPSNNLQIWKLKRQKSDEFAILDHHSLPFKWRPNLEVKTPEKLQVSNFPSPLPTLQMTSKFGGQNTKKVTNLQFRITIPYPSNDLQIWRSKHQKSDEFAILDHHSLPFKWRPNLEVEKQEKWRICNFGPPLPTLQMTSKFRGQNARKVASVQFWITTPYPSNGLQIQRSKRQKSCKCRILHHHSLPFKWPSNLEVKTPEKWRICNFGSPLPTLQMTSKFRGRNARKVMNLQFWITSPYPSNDLQI